jgi:hypothetical protein
MVNCKVIPQVKPLTLHKGLIKMSMKVKTSTMIMSKRRAKIKGGEDDGDKEESNSRAKPLQPRVHHNV